jgi:hypothetical protein
MATHVVNVLSKAVCWTAGLFAGITGLRPARGGSRLPLLESGEPEGGDMRAALLGRHRRQIMRALGAPPTAWVGMGVSVSPVARDAFWHASTWYYPVNPAERTAIAIRFERDLARHVEYIGAPG